MKDVCGLEDKDGKACVHDIHHGGEHYFKHRCSCAQRWENTKLRCPGCGSVGDKANGGRPTTKPLGLKYDSGKPRVELIRPSFILGVGQVLAFGAKKYAAENWEGLRHGRARELASVIRHVLAYRSGEVLDPESGLPHLDHAACDLMFVNAWDLSGAPELPVPCGNVGLPAGETCTYCYPGKS